MADTDTAVGVMVLCCVGPLLALLLAGVVYVVYQHRSNRHRVYVLSTLARESLRDEWLATLPHAQYRSELEVEVKFIAPLVEYFGFSAAQVDVRLPVSVPVGRELRNGIADWVLWSADRRRPLIVVEAKAPGQSLNGAVQSQARSYAFALGAPLYLLTNGARLQMYRRGVETDACLVDCPVDQLAARWQDLAAAVPPVKSH